MVLSLIVIRIKGCNNLLRFFVNTFCRSNKTFLKYGNMFVSYQKMVINTASQQIYILYMYYMVQENNFVLKVLSLIVASRLGWVLKPCFPHIFCMHKIIYNVESRKSLYVYIRAQNVVLHCLTLSSFTCLLWYDLLGV